MALNKTTYAVLEQSPYGKVITTRALPSMKVAEKIAKQVGGKGIIDPRSIVR
jgi:hypothetical protein